jgi:acyl-CoA reductase-like NAD-dependent aldehyde dehydrogenase
MRARVRARTRVRVRARARLRVRARVRLRVRARVRLRVILLRPGEARLPTSPYISLYRLPGEARRIQKLIDEAVAAGATVAAGGVLPAEHADQAKDGVGVPQFYPPTIVLLPSILTEPSLRSLVSAPSA